MTLASMDTDEFLIKYKPLIFKTLHRLNIKQNHMDYDDYYQELLLHLLKIRNKFIASKKYADKDDKNRQSLFIAYAKRGLYWHGVNMIKKNQTLVFNSTEDEELEWLSLTDTPSSSQLHENICLEDFFLQARKRLTDEDYKLLLYLSDGRYSNREIAVRMQVSLSVIYTRKEKIQKRLEGIKECLKD